MSGLTMKDRCVTCDHKRHHHREGKLACRLCDCDWFANPRSRKAAFRGRVVTEPDFEADPTPEGETT